MIIDPWMVSTLTARWRHADSNSFTEVARNRPRSFSLTSTLSFPKEEKDRSSYNASLIKLTFCRPPQGRISCNSGCLFSATLVVRCRNPGAWRIKREEIAASSFRPHVHYKHFIQEKRIQSAALTFASPRVIFRITFKFFPCKIFKKSHILTLVLPKII